MTSTLFIRIIGGLFGGVVGAYLSGNIYNYFNRNKHTLHIKDKTPPETSPPSSNYQNIKQFDDILNLEIEREANNTITKENINYERSNSFEFKRNEDKEYTSEMTFINDALYDNNFEDFYQYYIMLGKEN